MGSQQEQSMPPVTTTTPTSAELLQSQTELLCHRYGYLKSMALHCAIKLGIPNAMSRYGGATSLSHLHDVLPIASSKWPCLSCLMRFLAASGIFKEEKGTAPASQQAAGVDRRYCLTTVSRLLVDVDEEDGGNGNGNGTCLAPFVALCMVPAHFMASLRVAEWLETEDDGNGAAAKTPFMMAHVTDLWGMIARDAEFGALFNEGMGSDSRFVAPADGGKVEFVAGDMMEFIPPADALLLKFILHDWSDEECVRILKRCKQAISTREPKGKVTIIDTVVGSASNQTLLEAQLLIDLSMMVPLTGKKREEEQWSRLFMDAGFTRYKISPVLGCRSLIEVYP